MNDLGSSSKVRTDLQKADCSLEELLVFRGDDSSMHIKEGTSSVRSDDEYGRNGVVANDASPVRPSFAGPSWSGFDECSADGCESAVLFPPAGSCLRPTVPVVVPGLSVQSPALEPYGRPRGVTRT